MSLASLLNDAVGIWKHREPREVHREIDSNDLSELPPDVRRLIRNGRYCRILLAGGAMPFDEPSLACAWQAVERDMAMVPAGTLRLWVDSAVADHGGLQLVASRSEPVAVESIYLDRNCVTNADFLRFVEAGGYGNPHYWPEEVLPNVLQFTDQTEHPAPRFWSNGTPPADKLDHPVVGVSWYEANAYATWVGKRLPTTEEWQRAGTWPQGHNADHSEQRYPWGNSFDPSKANLWATSIGDTVPVHAYPTGNTPNGVRQLVGNVWEWVNTSFAPHAAQNVSVALEQGMAEIRGGAFDTYFHSQATCQFRTGQPLLFRGANVGFRCCVRSSALPAPVDSHPACPNEM
ncbi:MAG: formylglycine-generating enzyme family protein [Planctomycetaceae bacterium]